RAFPGVTTGHEEQKMGIKGSSTTAVFFDNVHVPVENLLGEIGRGHIIAFNILNLGRLKLGPFSVGGARKVLRESIAYAKQRKAFGTEIANFGMIQHKLAEMAIRIYAVESMTYRVEGLIESRIADLGLMKAVEEFAAECSIVKVYATEMLDYVVDEGVQIHGGYGYHQDYAVERAYRDSRINRIFEGTNEINRLLTTGMLLKRAARGQLGLVQAATGVLQEILANITDVIMDIFAMESALLRTQKLAESGKGANAADMTAVLVRDAMAHIDMTARIVLAACSEGDSLRTNLVVLRRFGKYEPVDAIALRRKIAHRLLDAERYIV
ncbi:MAG: acyl-CoA dehydrogenase family protein, partial [Bryobacteraceae bacterium]